MKIHLLNMCYFEQQPGKWLKPVGYHMFCFEEATKTWTNVLRTYAEDIAIWDAVVFEQGDFLQWLKDQEAGSRINTIASSGSHFELNRWAEALQ